MRRIDLLAKLLAPVFVSLLDEYSFTLAIWVVFVQNAMSIMVEYFAIAQVGSISTAPENGIDSHYQGLSLSSRVSSVAQRQ